MISVCPNAGIVHAARTAIRQSRRASEASDRDMIAAVHGERVAGDIAGVLAGEEPDGGCNLLRRGEPLHRNAGHHCSDHCVPIALFRDRFAQKRRVGWARADGVGGDAQLGSLPPPGGKQCPVLHLPRQL